MRERKSCCTCFFCEIRAPKVLHIRATSHTELAPVCVGLSLPGDCLCVSSSWHCEIQARQIPECGRKSSAQLWIIPVAETGKARDLVPADSRKSLAAAGNLELGSHLYRDRLLRNFSIRTWRLHVFQVKHSFMQCRRLKGKLDLVRFSVFAAENEPSEEKNCRRCFHHNQQ